MVSTEQRRAAPPTQASSVCPAPHEVRIGTRFGAEDDLYEVDGELGSGAAARVFACRRLRTGEELAVKAVDLRRLSLLNDAEGHLQRLDREVRILKRLRHERIVELRSVHRTQNWYFLVMERVWGGELFSHIVRQGSLGEPEARQIFKQLLEGVRYMHSRSVIHRDLKPENILIVRSNPEEQILDVKIADFGLSKVICDGASEAKTFVGTPQYWAPEVLRVRRGGGTYGQEADLWGLGAVLFVMLSGRYPFDGRKVPLDEQIQRASFNLNTVRWKDVSEDAKDLIRSLLRVNPTERLCLEECLRHPWVTGHSAPEHPLDDSRAASSNSSANDHRIRSSPSGGPARTATGSSSCSGGGSWGHDELLGHEDDDEDFHRQSSAASSQDWRRGRRRQFEDYGGGGISEEEESLEHAISESLEEVPMSSRASSRHSRIGSQASSRRGGGGSSRASAAAAGPGHTKQRRFSTFRHTWGGWVGYLLGVAVVMDYVCRRILPEEWRWTVPESPEGQAPGRPTPAASLSDVLVNGSRLRPWMEDPGAAGKKPWLTPGSSPDFGTISAEDGIMNKEDPIFRLQELLQLQVSIAGSLEVTMHAFRRADADLAESARRTYEEARDLFQNAAKLVSHFGLTAQQVTKRILPDLNLAVAEQEPNLAIQLLVMVKSWVADMKTEGEDMQSRYEKLHETVLGLANKAQQTKAGSDQRLAEAVRRSAAAKWTAQDPHAAYTCNAHGGKAPTAPATVHSSAGAGPTGDAQPSGGQAGRTPLLPHAASAAQAASAQGMWSQQHPSMQALFEQLLKFSAESAEPVAGASSGGPRALPSRSSEVVINEEADKWKQDVVELLFMAPGAFNSQHLLPAPAATFNPTAGEGCEDKEGTEDDTSDGAGDEVDSGDDAAAAGHRPDRRPSDKKDDVSAVVPYDEQVSIGAATESAAESSMALLRALRELRRVGAILQGCSAFWQNMDGTVSKLQQMKEHTEALVMFAGSNPRLRERFEHRLQEYASFWISLERLCQLYASDHQVATTKMQEFIREVRDMADVVDTAASLRAGAAAASHAAAREHSKRQAAAAAATSAKAASAVTTLVRPVGVEGTADLYEEVDMGSDGVQIVVSD